MLGWRHATAPALLVTVPLAGYSLLGDERRRLFLAAHRFGSDPRAATSHAWDTVGGFLDAGNFRPLGRAFENFARGLLFDAAEATGLAPQAVFGVVRLAAVALLALVCCRAVAAVLRSAEALPGRFQPAVVLYPMALAATLVAANDGSPIVRYPDVVVGSSVLIIVIALSVSRDKDLQARPLAWHEPLWMALTGAVAASTYDLLYVSPPWRRPSWRLAKPLRAARHGNCCTARPCAAWAFCAPASSACSCRSGS